MYCVLTKSYPEVHCWWHYLWSLANSAAQFVQIISLHIISLNITLLRFIHIVAPHPSLPHPSFIFLSPTPTHRTHTSIYTHTYTYLLIFFTYLFHFPATFLLEINLEVHNSLFHYYRPNLQRFVISMPKICFVKIGDLTNKHIPKRFFLKGGGSFTIHSTNQPVNIY